MYGNWTAPSIAQVGKLVLPLCLSKILDILDTASVHVGKCTIQAKNNKGTDQTDQKLRLICTFGDPMCDKQVLSWLGSCVKPVCSVCWVRGLQGIKPILYHALASTPSREPALTDVLQHPTIINVGTRHTDNTCKSKLTFKNLTFLFHTYLKSKVLTFILRY